MYNRIRNTVDSPGGDPESEPELANGSVETTGGRGATWSVDETFVRLVDIVSHLGGQIPQKSPKKGRE